MSEYVKVYTSEDLKPEKLNGLTLVDFWATWCGPCRMVAPIVEELASETPDVTFAKVDVDENPDVAMGLGITSIPTLMLFKNGKLVDKLIGARPKQNIRQMIDAHR
ncbi:MAG: thioredoxin [Clostridia bacterium]|nr:thioredoxin [Clostridia bacterium]